MIELKPCPFCGEKEDIDYGYMIGTMRGYCYVCCNECLAEIHTSGTPADAIRAWNRRVEHDSNRN